MLKIFLIAATMIILVFIVFTIVVRVRSDRHANKKGTKGAADTFCEKQICSKCKTGKNSYELDPKSDMCPNILCWKNGECEFYTPISTKGTSSPFSGCTREPVNPCH